MMNGMKLGSVQPKSNINSFAFENQFMDYENEDQSQQDIAESEQLKSEQHYNHHHVQDLPHNSKVSSPEKKGTQGKRLKNLSSKMDQLSVSILQMKQKYNDLNMEEVMFRKRDQKKQEQIRQFLRKKHEQKRKLQKKMKKVRERQAKKLEESIILEHENQKHRVKDRIQSQIHKMSKQKEHREIEKQKKMQDDRKAQEMLKKMHQKEKKKFYLRKQEEDRRKKIEQRELEKEYLMKRKEHYKPLNLDDLDDHERKHRQLIEELDLAKRQKKQSQYRKILEKNEKMGEIFRGHSYDYVQEEIEDRRMKKQEPYEKYKKMKNYQEYVRENFVPKTHQIHNKSTELSRNTNASSLSHREVKRYRYIQGVAYGEVVQNRPVAKSESQQRKMGNNYMAYMKSLPKKKQVEEVTQFTPTDIQLVNHRLNSIVKIKKQNNPLYERKNRRSLDVKISDKPTREQLKMVIDQLKMKDKQAKMHEKVMLYENTNSHNRSQKSKQINSEIIDNIERKLNLLAKL